MADSEPREQKNALTEKVSYDAMMADFEGRGVDSRFLQLLSKAKPIRWGLFHHPQTSTYYRDRAVLLGDNAHASLPYQAAGAAQGVEDAVVLSNLLTEIINTSEKDAPLGPYISAAFEAYDSIRRPRAQKQLEQSAEVARMLFFQHEEAGSDMSSILSKLQQGRFNWLWFHDIGDDVQSAILKMKEAIPQNHAPA